MNGSSSDQPGVHRLLFARADVHVFFADLLGEKLTTYPNVNKYARCFMSLDDVELYQILMNRPIQPANSVLCELYCFTVAHLIVVVLNLISKILGGLRKHERLKKKKKVLENGTWF